LLGGANTGPRRACTKSWNKGTRMGKADSEFNQVMERMMRNNHITSSKEEMIQELYQAI
jgi:hypothetical protein